MFRKLGRSSKEIDISTVKLMIEHFSLPMFYKGNKGTALITNEAFNNLAGQNRKKIFEQISNLNTTHHDKFEEKIINDIGQEIDALIYVSEGNEGKFGVILDISENVKSKNLIHMYKDRYEIATEGSHEGLWEWNYSNGEVFYSKRFKEIMGVKNINIENKINTWIDKIVPEDRPEVIRQLENHLNQKTKSIYSEHRIVINDGIKWVSITGKAKYEKDTNEIKIIGFLSDITQRKEAQLALKDSEEQFKLFMKNLPAGAFIKDVNGKFIFSNRYLNNFFNRDSIVGLEDITVFPEAEKESLKAQNKKILQNGFYTNETKLLDKEKNEKYFQAQQFVINRKNKKFIGGIYSDITEQKQTESKLNILAHYDALTNLPNRMMFHESLKRRISKARRSGTKLALMFIDLDNFKTINDTLGHDYGDMLLKEVAARFHKILREEDLVARLGGDEFTVILDDIQDTAYSSVVAQKIIDSLSQPVRMNTETGYIGASIGIAIFPDDTNDIEQLIKDADMAMYKAKTEGKNAYRYFTEDMNANALEKLELTNDLRQAIESEQLTLHYQPIVNIETNTLHGLEALVRWEHPKYGLITPESFISIAEEGGFMVKVGKWILSKTCTQIKRMEAIGVEIKIAVNISSKQLTQNDLLLTVKSIVKESEITPNLLELEVNENFLMEDINKVSKVISELKKLGVSTSIDDFGTGYSSLIHLKKLPITKLKIDKSFIRDIPEDKDDMVITKTIITLASQLSLEVSAEGVETEEQARFLQKNGCYIMQGYLFSEPIPEDKIDNFLIAHKK